MQSAQSSFAARCRTQFALAPGKSAALGSLVIVLVVVVVVQLRGGATSEATGASPELIVVSPEAVAADPILAKPRRQLPPLHPSLTRDLFVADWLVAPVAPADPAIDEQRPATSEDTRMSAVLALEVTYVSGTTPLAIINGRTLRIGDTIERYVVDEIHGRHVVLSRNGRQTRLTMP